MCRLLRSHGHGRPLFLVFLIFNIIGERKLSFGIFFLKSNQNWTETDSLPPLPTCFSRIQSGSLGDSVAVELLFLKRVPSFHPAALGTRPAVWGCQGGLSSPHRPISCRSARTGVPGEPLRTSQELRGGQTPGPARLAEEAEGPRGRCAPSSLGAAFVLLFPPKAPLSLPCQGFLAN